MEEKLKFVTLAQSGRYVFRELCQEFGISRKNGYKWLGRYREHGVAGLEDRSRAPLRVPRRTGSKMERLIVKERRRHRTWGPKKIAAVLARRGEKKVPALSTVGEILKRHGMVEGKKRRPGSFKVRREELTPATRCNQIWAVDFKGWFILGNGERCDPLTITDQFCRYIIRLEAVLQATQHWTRQAFARAFKAYGMPEIIRVDNGSPFASLGPGGLSKLSVWWITLGIRVEFIRPGKPQDNGQHERMHRTMKKECCQPASANRAAQQRRFERWRQEFNHQRPHESLGQRFPADHYQASVRRYDPCDILELYRADEQTLLVNEGGAISWEGKSWAVGEALAGQRVVLEDNPEEKAAPGTKLVRFANVPLGIIGDAAYGRLRPTASVPRKQEKHCIVKAKKR